MSKPYIEMNAKLRAEAKNDFEKDFLKLMNNSHFGKTMQNLRKHRDIELVISDKGRNQLVSERNYHNNKMVFRKIISSRNEKDKSKNE